jgi:hypothetical protein
MALDVECVVDGGVNGQESNSRLRPSSHAGGASCPIETSECRGLDAIGEHAREGPSRKMGGRDPA